MGGIFPGFDPGNLAQPDPEAVRTNRYGTPRLGQRDAPARGGVGFGFDKDGDGRFDAARDAYIAWDTDRDGDFDNTDLVQSNMFLKHFLGQDDENGDGQVSADEKARGDPDRANAARIDADHDGVLEASELAASGARVVTQDKNGKFKTEDPQSFKRDKRKDLGPNTSDSGTSRINIGPEGRRMQDNVTVKRGEIVLPPSPWVGPPRVFPIHEPATIPSKPAPQPPKPAEGTKPK